MALQQQARIEDEGQRHEREAHCDEVDARSYTSSGKAEADDCDQHQDDEDVHGNSPLFVIPPGTQGGLSEEFRRERWLE